MSPFDRRSIMKLLGLGALGSTLPWTRSTSAQSGEVPLRLLCVDLGHGARRGTWEPNVAGPADPPALQVVDDWSLQPVMAALTPYRSRINLFQNLDMVSADYDPLSAVDAHVAGATHMLTAANRQTGELSGGVSIDQLIAQQLNAGQLVTRLQSLEVGAREDSEVYSNVFHHHAYATPGEKLPFLSHIPAIWDHIFPDPLPTDVEERRRAVAKKTSVYDFLRGDYERLIGRLPEGDRTKIEAMLDERAALQRALELHNEREANRPPESILEPWTQLREGYQEGHTENRLWFTKSELVSQLVASALHTDTTRVANYVLALPPDYEVGYTPGTSYSGVQTDDWHDLAHKVSGDNPELDDVDAQQMMFEFEKATYDRLAALLAYLDSLPETDGGTLLDHTLILVYSHIAEGSHDVTRLPWLLIGNAHGALSTGHYVRFPITHRESPSRIGQLDYPRQAADRIYQHRGRPHNDLFLTIARAMGLPLESFGRDMAENKGPITQLLV